MYVGPAHTRGGSRMRIAPDHILEPACMNLSSNFYPIYKLLHVILITFVCMYSNNK